MPSSRWLLLGCALLLLTQGFEAAKVPGRRRRSVSTRVANGVGVTDARLFPYIASVYYNPVSGTGAPYLGCTGTILRPDVVLTAARCVTNTDGDKFPPAFVLATNALGDQLRGEVKDVDWPRQFSGWSWKDATPSDITNFYNEYDVAIIYLKSTTLLNSQQIKIWTDGVNPFASGNALETATAGYNNIGGFEDTTDQEYVNANQLLTIAGFGVTAPGGNKEKLNVATVAYVSAPIPSSGRLTQLLAGNVATSAQPCDGDYGAPLLVWNAAWADPKTLLSRGNQAGRDPASQRQLGIFSNGPPCGTAFATAFYTDLRYNNIRAWLNWKVPSLGLTCTVAGVVDQTCPDYDPDQDYTPPAP